MEGLSSTAQERDINDLEDMHICSQCGYSRSSVESVIEHLKTAHDGQGQVRTFQREKKPKGQLRQLLGQMDDLLKLVSK